VSKVSQFDDGIRGFFLNTGGEQDGEYRSLLALSGEFSSFLEKFAELFRTPKSDVSCQATLYAKGLFQASERNIEKIEEEVTGSEYHKLYHFLSRSPWDDSYVDRALRKRASLKLKGAGRVGLIFDPTSFKKKGHKSVAVGRQWVCRKS
jgi:SRSO17 transposase